MATHTIQVSDIVYDRLVEQADRLQTTPEQLLERLLTDDILVQLDDWDDDLIGREPTDEEAIEALERLTTLFADASIPNLDELLNDPMLALANVGLITNDDLFPR